MAELPSTVQNEPPGTGGADAIDSEPGETIQTPYYRRNEDPGAIFTNTTKPHLRPEESHTTPVFVFTAIFGLIFIIAPLFVRQGPNRSITRVCIMISTVCCWIFWTTTYIVQMNPLLGPRLSNHSLAWIGYKWGHDPGSLPAFPSNDTETTTEPIFTADTTPEPAGDDANLLRGVDESNAKENADANELGPVSAGDKTGT